MLVAHQFVAGAAACESEEPSVGGVDSVDAALFNAFDYVALGHLHSPQKVGRETLRYCGTPLKYSFSEAGQCKSATFVELGAKGEVHITTAPLTPRHELRGLRGSYMELTDRRCYEGTAVDDYLYITLTDEQDVPDALARLRVIYPNLMQLDYDNQRTRQQQEICAPERTESISPLEHLAAFYQLQNNHTAIRSTAPRDLHAAGPPPEPSVRSNSSSGSNPRTPPPKQYPAISCAEKLRPDETKIPKTTTNRMKIYSFRILQIEIFYLFLSKCFPLMEKRPDQNRTGWEPRPSSIRSSLAGCGTLLRAVARE